MQKLNEQLLTQKIAVKKTRIKLITDDLGQLITDRKQVIFSGVLNTLGQIQKLKDDPQTNELFSKLQIDKTIIMLQDLLHGREISEEGIETTIINPLNEILNAEISTIKWPQKRAVIENYLNRYQSTLELKEILFLSNKALEQDKNEDHDPSLIDDFIAKVSDFINKRQLSPILRKIGYVLAGIGVITLVSAFSTSSLLHAELPKMTEVLMDLIGALATAVGGKMSTGFFKSKPEVGKARKIVESAKAIKNLKSNLRDARYALQERQNEAQPNIELNPINRPN